MKKVLCLFIIIFLLGLSNTAIAAEKNFSVGWNYTMAYDSSNTRGGGSGIQFDFLGEQQNIRITYMGLSGTYYTGVNWSASLLGLGYIYNWKNESRWTPYAGIGVVNVSITALLNTNVQSSFLSPASIVGVKYKLSDMFDIYGEINSIAGTQGITSGISYKF